MNNKEEKHLFTLGFFSKKYLILYLFCPLLYFLNNQLSDYVGSEKLLNENQSFFSIYLGYCIVNGILYLIFILNNKELSKKSNFFLKKNEKKKLRKKKCFFFLLLISLECLSTYIFVYFGQFKNFNNLFGTLCPLQLISLLTLSKYLFKLEMYKHHYLSLIVITIGLLIINFINFFYKNKLNSFNIIIGALFLQYIYPLLDMIGFHIFNEMQINFFLSLIIIGIMGFIIGSFFLIFNSIFGTNILGMSLKKNEIDFWKTKNITAFIFVSIFRGITYTLVWSIFSVFKPWFYGISTVITAVWTFLFSISPWSKNKPKIIHSIFQSIIYFFLIFACLIFNEQIICNFWELDKNTKNKIEERASREIYQIELSENQKEDKDGINTFIIF